MAKQENYKPGETVPYSGQAQIIGPRGGHGPERTVVEGKTFPPTPQPGSTYKIVDKTKTK